LLERLPIDRDPRRQVLGLLEQPVEVRLFSIRLLDDHRNVLELRPDLRRQRIHRATDVRLELGHQYFGRGGRRFATRYTVRIPNANPPMCANTATPPVWSGCVIPTPPCHSCSAIQTPRNQIAGISRKKMRPK